LALGRARRIGQVGIADGRPQIGVFTGSVIIPVIALAFVRWIGASRPAQLLMVGFLWLVLTPAFEILFGWFVMALSWERVRHVRGWPSPNRSKRRSRFARNSSCTSIWHVVKRTERPRLASWSPKTHSRFVLPLPGAHGSACSPQPKSALPPGFFAPRER
jgi:hypothetical protein